MKRRALILGLPALLAACASGSGRVAVGSDGRPLQRLYRIRPKDLGDIQFRLLDGVNTLRGAAGVPRVELNAALNAAAATHSRDMAIQNRPWHFGSDGSSPIDRINRVGYQGILIGETISETYETELETLGAWMQEPQTRTVILDDRARDLGFGYFQEDNGKIWWTMVLGAPGQQTVVQPNVAAAGILSG
ncbi:CAP domain-containing protein [Shimia ponticola]|uniref:CAP domain-containing protein n=1 Tax=Shimia ponticola TaxID=2582893 RepID=UPI0011BE7C87|nr:CAP domain-containing protein [Shimia ponticola]